MTSLTQLPGRPLGLDDVAALNVETALRVVPYGGVPGDDEVSIYAVKVKVSTEKSAHALGFDESRGRWQRLASVTAADLAAADNRLDDVLDKWVQDRYGAHFDVLKTA